MKRKRYFGCVVDPHTILPLQNNRRYTHAAARVMKRSMSVMEL